MSFLSIIMYQKDNNYIIYFSLFFLRIFFTYRKLIYFRSSILSRNASVVATFSPLKRILSTDLRCFNLFNFPLSFWVCEIFQGERNLSFKGETQQQPSPCSYFEALLNKVPSPYYVKQQLCILISVVLRVECAKPYLQPSSHCFCM